MKIINGKLYKEITTRKDREDRKTKTELTLYREIENRSTCELPEYRETGNNLGIIKISSDTTRPESLHGIYYKDELYKYLIHVEGLFDFANSDDYIFLCMNELDITKVTLDHKALTYIGLLCGARHDIMKATKLNISDTTHNISVFVMVDDNGDVEDILYSASDDTYSMYELHHVEPSEYRSAYNTDIKKYLRNIVNELIEYDLVDKYNNIDLTKIISAKLGENIKLPIYGNKDQSAIIISEDVIRRLPRGTHRVNMTVTFGDCEDRNIVLELPRRSFPAKEGMYVKTSGANYIIPITDIVGSIMYWETFNAMSYSLDKSVFDYVYHDNDVIGFDTPGISLEYGVYLDLVPMDSDYLVQRFYAQDRSAYENVWEIYNCDKFERMWIAYIDQYNIDKM